MSGLVRCSLMNGGHKNLHIGNEFLKKSKMEFNEQKFTFFLAFMC